MPCKISSKIGSLCTNYRQCGFHGQNEIELEATLPLQIPKSLFISHAVRYLQQTIECTLVGLSTRPTPLIISKSLQFRTFWPQSKALFMIRCMLSVGSGSKTFGALKVTIYVKFFKLSVHKMSTFLRISACQWTMPSGLFAKKNHSKIFCSCQHGFPQSVPVLSQSLIDV